MLLSELIEQAEKLKDKYGDREVYTSGSDYPGPAFSLAYIKEGDAYTPSGVVELIGGI